MIRLSRTFVRIDFPKASKATMTSFGHLAYESTEVATQEFLKLKGTGTEIEVRDGSLVVVSEIVHAGLWLLGAVGVYGTYSAAIHQVVADALAAGTFIKRQVAGRASQEGHKVTATRVSGGDTARLDRICRSVLAGELTPSEGMIRTLRILAESGEELTPTLIGSLEQSFRAPVRGLGWLGLTGGAPSAPMQLSSAHEPEPRGRARVDARPAVPKPPKPRRFVMRREPGERKIREEFSD